MKKILLKDITIPKGSIFTPAPVKTTRGGNCHYDCVIGLSDNTAGFFTYCIDDKDFPGELDGYFTDIKGEVK